MGTLYAQLMTELDNCGGFMSILTGLSFDGELKFDYDDRCTIVVINATEPDCCWSVNCLCAYGYSMKLTLAPVYEIDWDCLIAEPFIRK